VKFKIIGNHKLRIETGTVDMIILSTCESNEIEEEPHFHMISIKYSTLRDREISFQILSDIICVTGHSRTCLPLEIIIQSTKLISSYFFIFYIRSYDLT